MKYCLFCGKKLTKRETEPCSRFEQRIFCDRIHAIRYRTKSVRERFEEYYIREPNFGCWLWTACCDDSGYGLISNKDDKSKKAHRTSWILTYGPIPDGMHVLHSCDNPPCVNPEHLFLGTHKDNMDDMNQKGRDRHPRGEDSGMSKLTEQQVLKIRERNESISKLCRRYKMSKSSIESILYRKTWRHI